MFRGVLLAALVGCQTKSPPPEDTGTDDTESSDDDSDTVAEDTDETDSDSDTVADTGTEPPLPLGAVACEGGETLLQYGPDGWVSNGLERCLDGRVHRVESPTCELATGAEETCGTTWSGALDCDDCDDPGQYCNSYYYWQEICACTTFSETDESCAPGEVTVCEGVYTRCVPADCSTDGDCGTGFLCVAQYMRPSVCVENPPEEILSFRCEQPTDSCQFDSDCGNCGGNNPPADCGCVDGKCEYDLMMGDCGRPLRIDDVARVAPLTSRVDWADDIGQGPRSEAAAAGWTAIALLEHASVASFAKFTLELLALGAPAHLVAESQAAQADEIDHARVSFGLARRFGAGDVGPGPLDLSGLVIETDPERFVRALVLEGCVGETLSAAEVREGARRAADADVRALLHRVADDEARHAALAWKTLAWLLGEDPTLIGAARRAFVEARGSDEADAAEGLEAFGLLGGRARREVRAAAWAVVVGPAMGALLSVGGRGAATELSCVAI